ncbi:MAG: polysaccharide deacetylase family protein [Myxococcales bacterium]|nr:polysaccharide deacetylase family protein [Myxococcales bacterium]
MPPFRIVLWVASLGGLALLARTLIIEPVPIWLALAAFVVYALLCTVGVLVPQLEMFGDVEWRGEPGSRAVALTFDDGPNPKTTGKVLEILAREGHKATFFVVGRKALAHADVIRQIHEAGHEIGLHGYQHDRLYSFKPPKHVEEDIARTQLAVEQACGFRPTLFRPPVGHVSSRTAAGAKRAHVRTVAWSARGLDGVGPTDAERAYARIEPGLVDGAIVLLHDSAERDDFEPASVELLPRLLEELGDRKLRAVTVTELLDGPLSEELDEPPSSETT